MGNLCSAVSGYSLYKGEFVQQTGAPCISKPFDFDEVYRVIGRALRPR